MYVCLTVCVKYVYCICYVCHHEINVQCMPTAVSGLLSLKKKIKLFH